MGKYIITLLRSFSIAILVTGISCCKSNKAELSAKVKADSLIEKISRGTAIGEFSGKYFPPAQSAAVLNDLKGKCDFANRKGRYINDFYQKNVSGFDRASYIYEYELKCGKIRFILTYDLGDKIELVNFKMEPISKLNPMVTRPENEIK